MQKQILGAGDQSGEVKVVDKADQLGGHSGGFDIKEYSIGMGRVCAREEVRQSKTILYCQTEHDVLSYGVLGAGCGWFSLLAGLSPNIATIFVDGLACFLGYVSFTTARGMVTEWVCREESQRTGTPFTTAKAMCEKSPCLNRRSKKISLLLAGLVGGSVILGGMLGKYASNLMMSEIAIETRSQILGR